MEFVNKIFKYGFHDTYIDLINISDEFIDLFFKNGLYELDENGTETVLTLPIKMRVFINNKYFIGTDVCTVEKVYPSYKSIDLDDFLKIITNKLIDVDNVFYSRFNQTILLKCGLDGEVYLFNIENVMDIDYLWE